MLTAAQSLPLFIETLESTASAELDRPFLCLHDVDIICELDAQRPSPNPRLSRAEYRQSLEVNGFVVRSHGSLLEG